LRAGKDLFEGADVLFAGVGIGVGRAGEVGGEELIEGGAGGFAEFDFVQTFGFAELDALDGEVVFAAGFDLGFLGVGLLQGVGVFLAAEDEFEMPGAVAVLGEIGDGDGAAIGEALVEGEGFHNGVPGAGYQVSG